jgi:hypothetical protein
VGTVVCTGRAQALVPGLWDLRTSAEGEQYVGTVGLEVRMLPVKDLGGGGGSSRNLGPRAGQIWAYQVFDQELPVHI